MACHAPWPAAAVNVLAAPERFRWHRRRCRVELLRRAARLRPRTTVKRGDPAATWTATGTCTLAAPEKSTFSVTATLKTSINWDTYK